MKTLKELILQNTITFSIKKSQYSDDIDLILSNGVQDIGFCILQLLSKQKALHMFSILGKELLSTVFESNKILLIKQLTIYDKYKNKGYGKILMNRVLLYSKSKQYKQLIMNASPTSTNGLSLNNLIIFYKKFGFEQLKKFGGNSIMYLKR